MDIEYSMGYTDALLTVKRTLEFIDSDMKRHKRKRTAAEYGKIIDLMIKGRRALREDPDVFIRCSSDGGYELFDQKTKQVVKSIWWREE